MNGHPHAASDRPEGSSGQDRGAQPSFGALVVALLVAALSVTLRIRGLTAGHEATASGRPAGSRPGPPPRAGTVAPVGPAFAPGRTSLLARIVGRSAREQIGTGVSAIGLLALLYAGGTYLELTPGSRVVIPDPPALARQRAVQPVTDVASAAEPGPAVDSRPVVEPTLALPAMASASTPAPAVASVATPPSTGVVQATQSGAAGASGQEDEGSRAARIASNLSHSPTPAPAPWLSLPSVADSSDRLEVAGFAHPGTPIALKIERLGIDTQVVEAGIKQDDQGNNVWETVPNVAAHYTVTGPVGAPGNVVISGHVVTVYEGNVFANLYQIDFGDRIDVSTADGAFVYRVEDIKLVAPDDVHVMAPTSDPTLTLITCGGEFNRRTTQFDKRLVVIGKLARS